MLLALCKRQISGPPYLLVPPGMQLVFAVVLRTRAVALAVVALPSAQHRPWTTSQHCHLQRILLRASDQYLLAAGPASFF